MAGPSFGDKFRAVALAMQVALEQMLQALVQGDFEAVDRHVYQVEWDAGTGVINAAFWIAVNRRFTAETGRREIADYVAELKQRYTALEPAVAEVLLRAALGEDHLVDGLKPDSALPVEMVLLHELVADESPTDEQLRSFLSETESLAVQNVSWHPPGLIP